ncbi:hypothetical protein [Tritonibacter horizontis]|uniref:hypothetical protein n=1 Tax=Tritonibacter horizontis TaxID=1768241 RepID=UPI001E478873|nr:hypothetical protein [Tritonibacter horizontis]
MVKVDHALEPLLNAALPRLSAASGNKPRIVIEIPFGNMEYAAQNRCVHVSSVCLAPWLRSLNVVFRFVVVTVLCGFGALPVLTAPQAVAGTIERACRSASGSAASAQLCNCIGQVAEQRLTRSEQRTVATWFQDPHRAQEVRQSGRSSDAQLWQKYQVFGSDAERICG